MLLAGAGQRFLTAARGMEASSKGRGGPTAALHQTSPSGGAAGTAALPRQHPERRPSNPPLNLATPNLVALKFVYAEFVHAVCPPGGALANSSSSSSSNPDP